MLPTLIIIGAMKTGTGSLHQYLADHPQVHMSRRKELHFFVEERNWGRGLEWYEGEFAGADSAIAVGESSTSYSMFPIFDGVPARMASVVPDVRLVYVVRDPIERMRSHYLENVHFDLERRERVWGPWEHDPIRPERAPFERALLENPVYVSTSSYATQIERYLEHFDRSQLMVLTTEDLRDRREETVQRLYRFIGVDDTWAAPAIAEEFNRTAGKRVRRPTAERLRRLPGYSTVGRRLPLSLRQRLGTKGLDDGAVTVSGDLRAELAKRLRPEIERLRGYVGGGFDGWGLV